MNDVANIATRIPATGLRPVDPAQPARGNAIEGSTATTPATVSAISPNDTVEQALALTKLDRAMASNEAPRTDVPRGYYLDISV